jgi:succinate dehydrogenase / fumarate reductase cytochrome b subunit
MNVLLRPVRTSVGSKYLMALTGLALLFFVIAHMIGNLLIFRGREALNSYAHALESSPVLLWTARTGLLAVFVLHVVLGIRLTLQNRAARPTRYVCEDTVQANWASRHMLLTGLVILAFVLYHLLHFTFGTIDPSDFTSRLDLYKVPDDPKAVYRDVAEMVVRGFRHRWITLSYVVAQLFLGLHLWHGAGSWFQSLGLNHPRYAPLLRGFAVTVATAVVVGNCSICLSILLGWQPR